MQNLYQYKKIIKKIKQTHDSMFHTQTKHRHIKLNNIEIIDDPVIKQATVNQECMNIIDKLIKIEKLHSTRSHVGIMRLGTVSNQELRC